MLRGGHHGAGAADDPGTLYNLLESFQQEDFIRVTKVEGRKKSYRITPEGRRRLAEEGRRLRQQTEDYEKYGEEVYT